MKVLSRGLVCLFLCLLPVLSFAVEIDIDALHKLILYPTVRIRASNNSVGSGIIFASVKRPGVNGNYDTYILTNHHVIGEAITIQDEWNSLDRKMEKKEKRATVEIEQFKYQNMSVATGTLLILADIVEWNKDHDLAIIKLRSDEYFNPILKLPKIKTGDLRIFQTIYICGSGLGRSPFPTQGLIASLQDEIDNLPYWMITAPTVFGNSGGGTFLAGTKEFIGIPSRLAVTWATWAPNAVYHMSYIVPISRIYKWLDDTGWGMLYDPKAKTREEWLKDKGDKANDKENSR